MSKEILTSRWQQILNESMATRIKRMNEMAASKNMHPKLMTRQQIEALQTMKEQESKVNTIPYESPKLKALMESRHPNPTPEEKIELIVIKTKAKIRLEKKEIFKLEKEIRKIAKDINNMLNKNEFCIYWQVEYLQKLMDQLDEKSIRIETLDNLIKMLWDCQDV